MATFLIERDIPDAGKLSAKELQGISLKSCGILKQMGSQIQIQVSSRLAAARATRSSYRDHGFAWNNTGRNGHYASFEWSGP